MVTAAQLINDNGISVTSLGFFTALLTAMTAVLKMVYDDRKERREESRQQNEKLTEALVNAKAAATNTEGTGGSFASGILGELRKVSSKVDQLSTDLHSHIMWHQNNDQRRR